MLTEKIVFIGAGNMSQAILHGLLQTGYDPANITVTAKTTDKFSALETLNVCLTTHNEKAAKNASILILAVKPQQAHEVLKDIKNSLPENCLVISVMTGPRFQILSTELGQHSHIVRTIPNTPTIVQRGVTGLYGQNKIDLEKAEKIFQPIGFTIQVTEESDLDKITGISGSGPAYFMWIIEQWNTWRRPAVPIEKGWFDLTSTSNSAPHQFNEHYVQKQTPENTLFLLMLNAMTHVAQDFGFSEHLAKRLSSETGLGTLKLITTSHLPVSELRAKVTSKKGTTEAAINVLKLFNWGDFFAHISSNINGLSPKDLLDTLYGIDFYLTIKKAAKAACERAHELSFIHA